MAHDIAVIGFKLKWAKATDKEAVNFPDIVELLRKEYELTSEQKKDLADILEAMRLDKVTFSGNKYRKVRNNKNFSEYTKLTSKGNEHEHRSVSRTLYLYHELFKWILNESEKCSEAGAKIKNKDTYVKPFVADIFRKYIQQNGAIFKKRNCKKLDRLELTDDVRKNYDKMLKNGTPIEVNEGLKLNCSGIIKVLNDLNSGGSINWYSVATFAFFKYALYTDNSYDQNEIDEIVKRESLKLSKEKRNSLT